MKIFHNGGDSITDSVRESMEPRKTIRRRRINRSHLLVLAVVLSIALSAYTSIRVDAALQARFPSTTSFSVGAAYQFADSSGNVLLPGDIANVTLTISSAVSKPQTIFISFNTSTPLLFGYAPVGACYSGVSRDLTMSYQGTSILPSNTDLSAPANCIDSGRPGPPLATSFAIVVNPGTNTFTATIGASPTASSSDFTTLNWFASQ